ncbi:MAG: FecR domain-containing protein [Planctomycetes bacterium]|nr:FecR domain-containing protein [Planctomycetota bacterium]
MNTHDWQSAIGRHLDGVAAPDEVASLSAQLESDAETRKLYLEMARVHATLVANDLPESSAEDGIACEACGDLSGAGNRPGRWLALSGIAAAIAGALVAGFLLTRPSDEPAIATITEMNGALQWTGDGGRIVGDLEAGDTVRGGTLESLSADSWAVLTFRDGSTVTVSGQSTLTISEDQQKQIHFRKGSMSAHVAAQRQGRPMLIHTPTAKLEVLGTQLNVDAEAASTTLRVNEGRVRATRLADGSVADVPSDHQVIVSANRRAKLTVRRQPESVRSWKSRLPAGTIYGQWIPGRGAAGGMLRAAPVLLNPAKNPITLHLASISVCRGTAPPVAPASGGSFHIRGRIEASGDLYFGLTMKHVKGGFAGKYVTVRRVSGADKTGQRLDIKLPLDEFRPQEKEFPDSPVGLELVDMWCFTYNQDAELRINSIELLPSAPSGVGDQPTTQRHQIPLMDIWTAAAQGNVEAVKRHLAAGAEINGAFVAPGIPASGATPLHLAVFCDQGEMAQFLIKTGANLNARAKDKHGGTPLHWAAALGRFERSRQLIDSGADVNVRDNNAFTPLDATNYDPKSRRKTKLKIAELLRARGGRSKTEHRKAPAL